MSEQPEVMEAAVPVKVKVKGVYIADSQGASPAPVVLLEDERARIVPIFVGLSEAISIYHALSGELSPRPMPHDLFISVLENLKARINRVLIDDLDGGVYYARLSIKRDLEESDIDARPSDCLALALRAKAPIEVQEKVVCESTISKADIEKLIGLENFLQ
ncbi:Bifunctional nuclease [uncultured archaeon]|nr:Bifunctional nuclease [uncultured archaeon]